MEKEKERAAKCKVLVEGWRGRELKWQGRAKRHLQGEAQIARARRSPLERNPHCKSGGGEEKCGDIV